MPFEYAAKVGCLSHDERLHFYEVLAHNLTVVIRSIWSDEAVSDAQKVDRIKWVNEILHRATAKVWVLRLNTHEWTEADFAAEIEHWVSQNQAIGREVAWAVEASFRSPNHGRDGVTS